MNRIALCVVGKILLLSINTALAQTQIYVQNNTAYNLHVEDIVVSGDPISKKAWKKGASTIAQGERATLLTLKRAGKVNWMDPTPRFIEPGKTVIFATVLGIEGDVNMQPIKLTQKLFGAGKSSRMWQAVAGAKNTHQWQNDQQDYHGIWQPKGSQQIKFSYRAYKQRSDTHVEYVFGGKEE